jgi:hypothetical protein
MRVGVDDELDVLELETRLADVVHDQRCGLRQAAVDEDVAIRRRDEYRAHAGRAHVPGIAMDAEGLVGPVPLLAGLAHVGRIGDEAVGQDGGENHQTEAHA